MVSSFVEMDSRSCSCCTSSGIPSILFVVEKKKRKEI
jgi:hypothetical protein